MDGPFLCEFCSELLASPKCLERHLKIHEVKDYQFLCYTCNKPFKNSDQLKHHERTHKTVKLVKCKYCHLKFRNRGSIVLHQESTHAWLKPFRCEKCHVGYSLSMECNAHVASHDVESLLMCPLCYRCFSHPLNLSLHLKKKHDIREVFRTKGVSSQTHAFLDCEWPFLKFIERIDTKDHCIYHGASRYVFTSNFSVKSLAHLLMEKYQFLRDCMIQSGKTPKCQSYVKRKRRKIKPTAKENAVKKAESFRCKVKKLFSTYSVSPLLKKARRLKRYFKEIRKEIRKIQSKSGLPSSQPLTRKLLSESLSPKSSTLSSFVGLIPHNDLVKVAMPSGNNRVVPCIVRVLPQAGSMMKAAPPSLERIIAPKPPKPIILEKTDTKMVTGHVSVPCLVRARQVVDKSMENNPNQFTTTKKPNANPKQGRTSPPIYAKKPNILSKPRSFVPNTPHATNPLFSQHPQGSTSWQQHPQVTNSWQQGAQGSTPWQQHPQYLSASAFKSNFQNIMFPDRNRMNTRFPIPTLNAESLAALSTCSYEDLSTFVEEFSILLVNKYFLSIFSPVQFPTYFIGNPPPTLSQLPQPVMRDLIVKQVDGQLIRRRIAEEVCRQVTPALVNIPSTNNTVRGGGSQAATPINLSSTSSTIRGGTPYNTHQPYTVSWNQPKRTDTLVKPLLNPASPSTSFTPSLQPYSINTSKLGKSGVSEAWLSSMKAYSGLMSPSTSTQIYSPRPPNVNSFESFKASTLIPTIVHFQKSFGSPMNLAIRQPIKGQTFIPLKDYMPITVRVNRSNKSSSIPVVPSQNIQNRIEQIENVSGKNFRLFEIIIIVPKLRIPKEDCVFRVISGGIAVKRLSKKGEDDSNDTYFDWSSQILTKRSLSSAENLKSGVVKKIPGGFAVRKSLLKTDDKVGRVGKNTSEKSNVTTTDSQLMTIEIEPPRKGRPPKFIKSQQSEAREKPKDVNKNKVKRKNYHYPIRSRSSSIQADADDQSSIEDSKLVESGYKYPLRNKQSSSKKVEINSPPPKEKMKVKNEKLESSEEEDGCILDSQTGNFKKVQKMGGTNKSPNSKNKSSQESKIYPDAQDLEVLLGDFQDRRLTRSRVKSTPEMTKKSLMTVTKHSKTSASSKPFLDIETRSLKNPDTKPIGVGEKTDPLQTESSCESGSSGSNSNSRKNTVKAEPNFKNSLSPKSTKSLESKTSNKKSKSPTSKPEIKRDPIPVKETTPPQSIKLWLPSDPEQTNEILEQCGFELSETQPYRSKPPARKLTNRKTKINKPSLAKKSESKVSESKSATSNSEASSDENLPLDLTQNRTSRSQKRFSTESLDDDSQQAKTRKTEPQDQRPSTSKDFREFLPKQLRKTNNSSQINFPDFSNRSLNNPSLSQKADEEMLDEPSTSRRGLRKDKKISIITNESWKAKVKSKKNDEDSPLSQTDVSTSRNSLRKLRNQVSSVSVQPNIAKTLKTSPQKPQKQSKYEPLIIDVKTHVDTSSGNQNSKNFVDMDAKSLSPTENVPLVAPKRLRSWNLCNRK